jgi:hypothetical protein
MLIVGTIVYTVGKLLVAFSSIICYYFLVFVVTVCVASFITTVVYTKDSLIRTRHSLLDIVYAASIPFRQAMLGAMYLLFFYSTLVYRFIRLAIDGPRNIMFNWFEFYTILKWQVVYPTIYTLVGIMLIILCLHMVVKVIVKLEVFKSLTYLHIFLYFNRIYLRKFIIPLLKLILTSRFFEQLLYITVMGNYYGKIPTRYFIFYSLDHFISHLTLYAILLLSFYDFHKYGPFLHTMFNVLPFILLINSTYKIIRWMVRHELLRQGWLQDYLVEFQKLRAKHRDYVRGQYVYISFDL